MPITIGALRESAPGESRVSLVPEVVDKFTAAGARVVLESGAGVRAQFPDALYKKGEWQPTASAVLSQADVLLTVAPLTVEQIGPYKIELHQRFLRNWITRTVKVRGRSLEEVWGIREACIAALSAGAR